MEGKDEMERRVGWKGGWDGKEGGMERRVGWKGGFGEKEGWMEKMVERVCEELINVNDRIA